jgi:2-keto-4-pentenoate hydratase/2-oxohepta-3-ene-1,7-dioic acid hydratase in catechol pathway
MVLASVQGDLFREQAMRIFTYESAGTRGVGVVAGDDAFVPLDVAAPSLPRDLRGILELPDGLERVRAALAAAPVTRPLAQVSFLPPIDAPNAFWALALNFQLHLDETRLTTHAEFPHLFLRQPASLVGHRQPLRCPPLDLSQEFDYEGELGVVIGRGGRHIPPEHALAHVAGYTCVNDGSIREFQRHNRNFGLGKNFEGSGSFGPWIVTPDELGDPLLQTMTTRLNGVERQKELLGEMIFSPARVIAYLSAGYRLRPGDVIAMGTPGALPPVPGEVVDPSRRRGRPDGGKVSMRDGDLVEVEISGLGILANPIVVDEPVAYRAG